MASFRYPTKMSISLSSTANFTKAFLYGRYTNVDGSVADSIACAIPHQRGCPGTLVQATDAGLQNAAAYPQPKGKHADRLMLVLGNTETCFVAEGMWCNFGQKIHLLRRLLRRQDGNWAPVPSAAPPWSSRLDGGEFSLWDGVRALDEGRLLAPAH